MCSDSSKGVCSSNECQGRQQEDELKVALYEPRINRAWYTRLLRVAMRYAQLQAYMAWYSTLGGAHSSLGDRFGVHAQLAGEISKKQLVLATRLGDAQMMSRCHLYMAFSLLQQGRLRQAEQTIIKQLEFANSPEGRHDKKLKTMCESALSRLQHQKMQLSLTYHHDTTCNPR